MERKILIAYQELVHHQAVAGGRDLHGQPLVVVECLVHRAEAAHQEGEVVHLVRQVARHVPVAAGEGAAEVKKVHQVEVEVEFQESPGTRRDVVEVLEILFR